MNLKHLLLLTAALSTIPSLTRANQPRQTTEVREEQNGLTKTETVYARSDNPLDRFTVHHVFAGHAYGSEPGVIFLLPPLGFDFDFYEMSETDDWRDSFVGFLASQGYDVYGYSPGTRGLAAGDCESGKYDCSVLSRFGLQSIVKDARFIRWYILPDEGRRAPIIAGLSMGAMSAIAVLNDAPDAFGAAMLWEGALYSNDAQVIALNQEWCEADRQGLASGQIYDGTLNPFAKWLALAAETAPDELIPIPGYPAGTTNYDAYVLFMANPPAAPVTAIVPGLQFLAADDDLKALLYASDARVFSAVAGLNDYVPNALVRDMNCSLAGDRTFTDNLGRFKGPLFVHAAGRGFGDLMRANVDLFGSRDVEWTLTEDIGHEEHFMAAEHERLLERPVLKWLQAHTR